MPSDFALILYMIKHNRSRLLSLAGSNVTRVYPFHPYFLTRYCKLFAIIFFQNDQSISLHVSTNQSIDLQPPIIEHLICWLGGERSGRSYHQELVNLQSYMMFCIISLCWSNERPCCNEINYNFGKIFCH